MACLSFGLDVAVLISKSHDIESFVAKVCHPLSHFSRLEDYVKGVKMIIGRK